MADPTFHDCATAPSPRRVRIFLAEKGVTLPTVQVDLRHGEHLGEAFRALNPWCTVPVLVLDDGTAISEAMAVCRYLEDVYPEPPLMGRDAKEKGVVAMWEHRFEADGFFAVAEVMRNMAKGFKGRGLTGAASAEQIPELAERGRARVARFFDALDARLGESEYVAGPDYTVADITAQVAVDFAGWIKMALPETHTHARRWHEALSARPSAGV